MAQESAAGPAKRYEMDAWLDASEAPHRVYIDSQTPNGGALAPRYASNMLNAHTGAYGGADADFSMVVCFRFMSTPMGWGDEVWGKYGAFISRVLEFPDPQTNEPFTRNPLNIADRRDLPNRGFTIESVRERGVQFAVCDGATRAISGMLGRATGGEAADIYKELVDSMVPDSHLVPAAVLTVTRAQEYGYSLLSAG
jgi:hypothetical protein